MTILIYLKQNMNILHCQTQEVLLLLSLILNYTATEQK
jgi:hypothetical protein